jgi:endonuclease/exonuclease/phosphatase family metal-dependent hydrolase
MLCRKFALILAFCFIGAYATDHLTGRVVDSLGSGLAGAVVTLINAQRSDTTGENGLFEISFEGTATLEAGNPQSAAIAIERNQLHLKLDKPERICLTTYDLAGRRTATLLDRQLTAGRHALPLESRNFPSASGSCILRLQSASLQTQWRVMLINGVVCGQTLLSANLPSTVRALASADDEADTVVITKAGYETVRLSLPDYSTRDVGDVILHALAQASFDVKVMSFNIRGPYDSGDNAWGNRKGRVCDVINKYQPDAIGFQEFVADYIGDIIAACPDYAYYGRGREADGSGESCRIFYRSDIWRVDEAHSGDFWYSETPSTPGSKGWGVSYPRMCTYVRLINKASGDAFYVFNSHWDHQVQLSRDNSARMLVQRIASRSFPDEPFVATGDFNVDAGNPAVLYLMQGADNPVPMTDAYRTLYPNAPNSGTFHNWSGATNGAQIDFVLSQAERYEAISAEIIHDSQNNLYPSDHFPIIGRLRFVKKIVS